MADWRLNVPEYKQFVETFTEDCIEQVFKKVQSQCPIKRHNWKDYDNPQNLSQEDLDNLKNTIVSYVNKWAELNLTPCSTCRGAGIVTTEGGKYLERCHSCAIFSSDLLAACAASEMGYDWEDEDGRFLITDRPESGSDDELMDFG